MAYFARVKFRFGEKVINFVIICETQVGMDLLCFPWQPKSAQCLQGLKHLWSDFGAPLSPGRVKFGGKDSLQHI